MQPACLGHNLDRFLNYHDFFLEIKITQHLLGEFSESAFGSNDSALQTLPVFVCAM